MIVDLNTADPFAANFECPDFIFSLQLGRRDYDIAISSDKMISRSLVPGSVTVSPKGSVIKAITGAVNAEFLAFCVSSGSVAEALDAAGRVPNDLRIVPDLQHPDIPNLAQMMRRFLLSPDRRTYIYGETLGLAILLNVIASLEAPKVAPRLALSARQVSQVCDYVDAHLAEQLSLADLARLLSMSVYHFNRAFGATMSMSPYQYIIERRVVYAREMLADPQLSLADVAYAVGFSSQAHMTDVFRKRLDTTPGAYRKEVLK
ncbi:MAG: AraC family transcriptional regulator [Pseudomonadota bacterium]